MFLRNTLGAARDALAEALNTATAHAATYGPSVVDDLTVTLDNTIEEINGVIKALEEEL